MTSSLGMVPVVVATSPSRCWAKVGNEPEMCRDGHFVDRHIPAGSVQTLNLAAAMGASAQMFGARPRSVMAMTLPPTTPA